MKRLFDIAISSIGLVLISPILLIVMFFVWINDFGSPFYVANRTGKNSLSFKMYKLRSMIVNADRSGVDSTASNDMRITRIGKIIRKFKMDELSQLINVFLGDMSLVGPRPNVPRETKLYTTEEQKLLSVRPGITDISSIIFSDEGDILKGSEDPDLLYNQIIRPYKSYFGLLYLEKQSLSLDIYLLFLTVLAIISKRIALNKISRMLETWQVDQSLINVAKRNCALIAIPPPGAKNIVQNRDGRVE
ncbi:sugar transferase [Schleiferiaceae bacterium]|nr:sugar transferase [Schleiferiaceae bacterium]